MTEQAREAILWKSSVEEVESTVQYFLSALQDVNIPISVAAPSPAHSNPSKVPSYLRSVTDEAISFAEREKGFRKVS